MAVFGLPPEMFGFYKRHIDFITTHAVDADRRRFSSPDEAPKHYIDIDLYGIYPFDSMPRKWKDAVAKYSEDSLRAHGILPWNLQWTYEKLIIAFFERNEFEILRLSADIGHYAADANVPLHASSNHDGQKTGQRGIHAFWETRLPELFANNYDLFIGNASYTPDVLNTTWQAVISGSLLADSLLKVEKTLSGEFPEDRKYDFKGKSGKKIYSEEYAAAYHQRLKGMVEMRMRSSIRMLTNLWFSAWVDAGQPDLDSLDIKGPSGDESPADNSDHQDTNLPSQMWIGRTEE